MKHQITQLAKLAVWLLLIVFPIASQTPETKTSCKPIKMEKLTRQILPLPEDSKLNSAKYFSLAIDSFSEVTFLFYDESKRIQSKVKLKGNPINKTTTYEISGPNSNVEWVNVVYSSENGGEFANAISSSNRHLKFTISNDGPGAKAKSVKSISKIEIIEGEGASRTMLGNALKGTGKADGLQDVFNEIEDTFYDTPQLKTLQGVLSSLNELQKIVVKNSVMSDLIEPVEGDIPNCNVYCVRVGTVVPVYACNDDTLNCSRCGVDGFYFIGGYSCFWFCSVPCRDFYGPVT